LRWKWFNPLAAETTRCDEHHSIVSSGANLRAVDMSELPRFRGRFDVEFLIELTLPHFLERGLRLGARAAAGCSDVTRSNITSETCENSRVKQREDYFRRPIAGRTNLTRPAIMVASLVFISY
jgi:hypothetical protein